MTIEFCEQRCDILNCIVNLGQKLMNLIKHIHHRYRLILVPPRSFHNLMDLMTRWPNLMLQVTALLIPGLSYASSLTVAMITVNRAAAIISPHNYRSNMTFRMSIGMVYEQAFLRETDLRIKLCCVAFYQWIQLFHVVPYICTFTYQEIITTPNSH